VYRESGIVNRVVCHCEERVARRSNLKRTKEKFPSLRSALRPNAIFTPVKIGRTYNRLELRGGREADGVEIKIVISSAVEKSQPNYREW